jgi:Holliday junction resolvase RusA-like endonuclease
MSEFFLEVTVPGVPVPQPRHRVRVMNMKGRQMGSAYIPAKHAIHRWKKVIQKAVSVEYSGPILAGELSATLSFALPRPKSHYGTGRNCLKIKDSAPRAPTKRGSGDVDNYAKAVLDALEGVIFRDDCQFTMLVIYKVYSGHGRETGVRIMLEGMTL